MAQFEAFTASPIGDFVESRLKERESGVDRESGPARLYGDNGPWFGALDPETLETIEFKLFQSGVRLRGVGGDDSVAWFCSADGPSGTQWNAPVGQLTPFLDVVRFVDSSPNDPEQSNNGCGGNREHIWANGQIKPLDPDPSGGLRLSGFALKELSTGSFEMVRFKRHSDLVNNSFFNMKITDCGGDSDVIYIAMFLIELGGGILWWINKMSPADFTFTHFQWIAGIPQVQGCGGSTENLYLVEINRFNNSKTITKRSSGDGTIVTERPQSSIDQFFPSFVGGT